MSEKIKNVAVLTNNTALSQDNLALLSKKFDIVNLEEKSQKKAQAIIVIGGDGTMLHSIHQYMDLNIPFYGIKAGHLGFLMNDLTLTEASVDDIYKDINNSKTISIYPLHMKATCINGECFEELALNEVSLLRQTHQAAKVELHVNGDMQIETLVSDGIIVSTPAGSTAYNLSAGGPILPINVNLLAITPISPFRPRRWTGALLNSDSQIKIRIIDPAKRPVSATADFHEVRDIKEVDVTLSDKKLELLFSPRQSFEDKTLKEQFSST
jgi:NAD+ kinase